MTIHATSSDLVSSAKLHSDKMEKMEKVLKHATISSSGGCVPPHLLVSTKPTHDSKILPVYEEEVIVTSQGTFTTRSIDYTAPQTPVTCPESFAFYSPYSVYGQYYMGSYPTTEQEYCEGYYEEAYETFLPSSYCPFQQLPLNAQMSIETPVVVTPRSDVRDARTALVVHNPYSFTCYEEVFEVDRGLSVSSSSICSESLPDMEQDCDCQSSLASVDVEKRGLEEPTSATSIEIPEEASDVKPRRQLIAPCGHHEHARRLRFKKGVSHYLCTQCSHKWRQ